jgi:hypothetical protein
MEMKNEKSLAAREGWPSFFIEIPECPNARMPVKVQKAMKSLYTEL